MRRVMLAVLVCGAMLAPAPAAVAHGGGSGPFVDGHLGPNTKAAVARFERAKTIRPADGVAGRPLQRRLGLHARRALRHRHPHQSGRDVRRLQAALKHKGFAVKATPKPRKQSSGLRARVPDHRWRAFVRLAQCESGGNWAINTGLYDGGLQFHPATWRAAGGHRFASAAHRASRAEQIYVANGWLDRTSWSQWPACTAKLGLR